MIRKVTPSGIISTFAGISAGLLYPTGLAIDSSNNLYVADTSNFVIRKITPGGIISTVAGNGTSGLSGDGGTATSAELGMPKGVAVDSRGNLFISDGGYLANASNNRIREVSGGIISTVAGGGTNSATAGSPALGVALSLPEGIITDSSGNVYFADSGTNTVNKVTFQSSHTSRT